MEIITQMFIIKKIKKIKTAGEESEDRKINFWKATILTKYRNLLHAFSLIPKWKASECYQICL